MVKKNVFITGVLFVAFLVVNGNSYAKESVIFNNGRTIDIAYSKCGTNAPIHLVKVDKENGTIKWKWDNKSNVWCGWGTESLPEKDLSAYLNGYLVISFSGDFQGGSPEIKFLDFDGSSTPLVNVESYMGGDPKAGVIIKIPIKKFVGDDKDFMPVNIKNIKTLQFDAEFKSNLGKITIKEIKITDR
ncbi:MAG: hypothetical protein H7844_04765 [Nitrospirae bacterium YQR-1]